MPALRIPALSVARASRQALPRRRQGTLSHGTGRLGLDRLGTKGPRLQIVGPGRVVGARPLRDPGVHHLLGARRVPSRPYRISYVSRQGPTTRAESCADLSGAALGPLQIRWLRVG